MDNGKFGCPKMGTSEKFNPVPDVKSSTTLFSQKSKVPMLDFVPISLITNITCTFTAGEPTAASNRSVNHGFPTDVLHIVIFLPKLSPMGRGGRGCMQKRMSSQYSIYFDRAVSSFYAEYPPPPLTKKYAAV